MNNEAKRSDYLVVGSLFKDEKISVSIACKGEKRTENLYLLNEFVYDKEDLYVFKKLFSIFSSPKKPKEFVDFFVSGEKFYAVFKYNETNNIKKKFERALSTTHFDDRCRILELILMKIDSINTFGPEFSGCISEPENIKVDDDKNIIIDYNLKNIFKYRGADSKTIYKNIHDVIFSLLPAECSAGFNKQLHIVLDKCQQGVYGSIPELIIELKKAEKISKASSWISYFKYVYTLKKPIIDKISKVALTTSIFVGIIYLAYDKLNKDKNESAAINSVEIGNVKYSASESDESDKTLGEDTSNQDNQSKNTGSSENITLTEGLDIAFEDYIVQDGDTVESICEDYYKEKRYETAISTFNGIEVNDKLEAGTILKLPDKTAIALYISR